MGHKSTGAGWGYLPWELTARRTRSSQETAVKASAMVYFRLPFWDSRNTIDAQVMNSVNSSAYMTMAPGEKL